jgi:hypothetical protein
MALAREAPDPEAGWSRSLAIFGDALVVPPRTAGLRQKTGVIDAGGAACPEAATWRFDRRITLAPDPAVPDGTLDGRWLWAGSLYAHFGHFLVESLSRLWALEALSGRPPDGILYVPKRPRQPPALARFQAEVFAALGVGVPVRVACAPVRVGELVVPGQGFGLGRISRGTPEMRHAMRRRFGAGIAPEGPERLYVSRSRTGAAGGIAGETALEALLAEEGYEIFHPQEHAIATQIARYKAARRVIISDGSAGHLFAHVGRADQRVAYLVRRSHWTEGPTTHIASFCGTPPLVPRTVLREWVAEDAKQHRGVAFALHDFAALQACLREAGFVGSGAAWPGLSEAEAEAYLRAVAPQIGFVRA